MMAQTDDDTDTPPGTDTDEPTHISPDIWLNALLAVDYLSDGDEITFQYFDDDGAADTPTPSGGVCTVTGTITKIVEGGAGGIFVDPAPSKQSTQTYKLHLIEGGTVTGTHKYGNRSVRHGLRAKINITEDMI